MDLWQLFHEYRETGGFVIVPLLLVSMLLWYALTHRLLNVRGSRHTPRQLIDKANTLGFEPQSPVEQVAVNALAISRQCESRDQLRSHLNEQLVAARLQLGNYRTVVHTLVAVAPLLGLLGTVDGMIETFDSLGDMVLFSQSGGIAGGISKALITTQIGLVISIPGLLLGRVIDRKEKRVLKDFYQVRDLICMSHGSLLNQRSLNQNRV